ncbi:hypothetical protein JX266_009614 [Neoarthrinium moseri]|nr:hypothetical protein JX266_009614 [Neoarthrinium moseri]
MASKRGMSVRVEYSESVYRRIRNEDRQLLRVEASFADPPVSHWGFVIYRTAYGKGTDSLFQRLITKIEADAITLTQRMGRSDLGNKLRWEVIDDQQCFDSVATEVVRENFIQLCLDRGVPLTETRPGQSPVYEPDSEQNSEALYWAACFRYCVVVDQRSLESVRRPGSTNNHDGPIVAIVSKDWLPAWHPKILRNNKYEDL